MLGRPLYVDTMTETCKRISFARICIEVDIFSELLFEFEVEVENEEGLVETITIRVEYQFKPLKCMECKCFGHDCTKRPSSFPPRDTPKVNSSASAKKEWVVVKSKEVKGKEKLSEHDGGNLVGKQSYFQALDSLVNSSQSGEGPSKVMGEKGPDEHRIYESQSGDDHEVTSEDSTKMVVREPGKKRVTFKDPVVESHEEDEMSSDNQEMLSDDDNQTLGHFIARSRKGGPSKKKNKKSKHKRKT